MKNLRRAILVLLTSVVGVLIFRREWVPDFQWLAIRTVEIQVQEPLKETDIRKSLGKIEGTNLLKTDGDVLMRKILQNPWALSATIKKEYPNKLVIHVQPKSPIAIRHDGAKLVFIGENGDEIDRWESRKEKSVDLPLVAFERPELSKQWQPKKIVDILQGLQKGIAPKYQVSQLVLTDPPYFKVFLNTPPLELLFSQHTWEGQLPFFLDVLSRPPRQIGQAHRINLVFPKKAVVSFPLSH